jgi:hypothetical protein
MSNDTTVPFLNPAFRDEMSGVGPVTVQLPKTRDRARRSHCFGA